MDLLDHLYLEVNKIENDVKVPIYTYIAMFAIDFCHDSDVCIHFVKTDISSQFYIPFSLIETFSIKSICFEDLPKCVKDSYFPVIMSADGLTCVGGLCAVLRWIVKAIYKNNSNHHCQNLLGFRNGCLMACSENSIWTKFCEVDMPETVKSFYECMINGEKEFVFPEDLLRLENHLQQPVKIHNILKRKQELAHKEKEKDRLSFKAEKNSIDLSSLNMSLRECNTNHKKNNSGSQMNKKSDKSCVNFKLPHNYVEGIDFTLADVILFPCVHHLLNGLSMLKMQPTQYISSVLNWYYRIGENQDMTRVMETWKWTIWKGICDESSESNVKIPVVKCESLYSRDPSRSKTRVRNQNPSEIINKLKNLGVYPDYSSHPREGSTSIKWEDLPKTVHPVAGDLPLNRITRKCQQVESIVTAVVSVANPRCVIIDFCAGGGHVGLLLAYLLPFCKVILIENKESSMDRARSRSKELHLENVFFYQCNMDYFRGQFDIGVCLHACGVATDLVIQQCIIRNATFICCPCCYGSIHNSHLLQYPRSEIFKKCGCKYEEYQFLCHCADRTEVDTPKVEEGKYCMGIIDMDRYFYAVEHNYSVKLCTLQPSSCSPKSNLLIGIPKQKI